MVNIIDCGSIVFGSNPKELPNFKNLIMSIFNKIKNFIIPKYKPNKESIKTIKELDFLDTVWIIDINERLLKGWVFDINKKHIIVTVPLENGNFLDFRFIITRPLSQTKLIQNNNILFLNKPCSSEISYFFQQKKDM